MLGTYKVAIKVFPGLTPEVTIAVEPKGYSGRGGEGGRPPDARTSANYGLRALIGLRQATTCANSVVGAI